MTKEEAIELLDNLIGMVEDNHNSDYDTALQMAIKALEQEPKAGHWINELLPLPLSGGSKECVICSKCGFHYDVASYFCPNCGCRMVKPQESENRNDGLGL